ncbi:MAG: ABC transporter transmembrane domain-containing protein, partial [Hydrogenophaga sp.]|nr:ABC transporter transmembrane domain-containing protein [Hydrogenophaga sp.]
MQTTPAHPSSAAPGAPQADATPADVLARMALDLDARGHFASGELQLTARELVQQQAHGGRQVWPLDSAQRLQHTDLAGVATLDLLDAGGLRQRWRFTLAQNPAALRLVRQFDLAVARLQGSEVPLPDPGLRCPSCQAPLNPDSEECEVCARQLVEIPSTWVLLRLWRFARPYRWQLLAGFLLMLASTAATLVPPYLTIPLMDNVLIPFQNGQQIDTDYVALLLSGLLGAALVAWGLGWARTWLLALVSERIAADLRTSAFDHLLGLSLDYFGAKRTGDLIARIGSETDRLSVFLSLHALDFATDVLMLLMTSAILFSINPWLALVTLLPLPFIAWMIHRVRDRLRTGFEKIDRVWGDVTNVLADTIPGIRVVKAFAQERRESGRFHEANAQNLVVNDRINKTWSLFTPTVTLLTDIGLLVVWAFGIWQIAKGDITVGV